MSTHPHTIRKVGPAVTLRTVLVPQVTDVAVDVPPPFRYECGACHDTGKLNGHFCPHCAAGVELHLDAIAADMNDYAERLAHMDATGKHGTIRHTEITEKYLAARIAYDNLERKFWGLKADEIEFEADWRFWNEDDAPDFRYEGAEIPY